MILRGKSWAVCRIFPAAQILGAQERGASVYLAVGDVEYSQGGLMVTVVIAYEDMEDEFKSFLRYNSLQTLQILRRLNGSRPENFWKRVLFLGAHPDDIEIGAGALIAKITDQCEVLCLTLSDNQKNPKLFNLVEEHRESMYILGVKPENDILGPFETRRFPDERQSILEYMNQISSRIQTRIGFCGFKG